MSRREAKLVLAYTAQKNFGLSRANLLSFFCSGGLRPKPQGHELREYVGMLTGIVNGDVAIGIGDDLIDLIFNLSRQYISQRAVGLSQFLISGGTPFDILVLARRYFFVQGHNNYRGGRRVL
jgi:hypothetical protein